MQGLAAAVLAAVLSACAPGGMRADGTIDPAASVEVRQKGVDRLVKDIEDGSGEKRARAAEMLPRYGALAVPSLVEVAAEGDLDDRLLSISILGEMEAAAGEALPFLLGALGDEDEFVRLAAVGAVAKVPAPGEERIPALRKVLDDPSPFVSTGAKAALASLYREKLDDPDPFVRVDAVRHLEETGPAGVPLLLAVLQGNDGYIRPAAAEVLGVTGAGNEEVVETLAAALGDGQYTLTRRALQSLYQFGSAAAPALPAVIGLLASDNSTLIKQSISTIGNMGPRAHGAAEDIEPFLRHRDPSIRWNAAKALLEIGLQPEEALPVFTEALIRGEQSYVRSREYFDRYGTRTLPYLLPLLNHEESGVRHRAVSTIGRSGASPDEVFPKLLKLLDDEHYSVRADVVYALASCGASFPESAADHLSPALESGVPRVRAGAAAVLVMIDPEDSRARELLIEEMSSVQKNVHHVISIGLLSMGEEGVRIAVEGLRGGAPAKCGAANVIADMGEKAEAAVPALMKIVEEDKGARLCGIRALRAIGPGSRAAVPLLVDALGDIRTYIQDAARSALLEIDPSALSRRP